MEENNTMTERQKKIIATGGHVARLQKGETIVYLNPVAEERAKIMVNNFHYVATVYDAYTLKPNNYKQFKL